MNAWRTARRLTYLASLVLFLSWTAARASAAELTVFISGASPGTEWGRGQGGIFGITLLNLAHGEIEVARQTGDLPDTSFLTLSAKAYLGPTIGRVVPYAGLGTGVYVEGLPGPDDRGTFGSLFVGVKLKIPLGFLVRGEVQWLSLPAAAPVPLDRRFFVGAGLSF